MTGTGLPADGHVHSEWSWDAQHGSMERTCARAVEIGLPAVAFTEHLDHTRWTVAPTDLSDLGPDHPVATWSDADGLVQPPSLDLEGYAASLERCRHLFPDLRIHSGVEVGEAHWHGDAVRRVLDGAPFDRVIGSLHCLPDEGRFREPAGLFGHHDPAQVLRSYLAEVARLVEESDVFAVLGHVDYPLRSWPRDAGPCDLTEFEEEFRHALRVTAASGRALEINTVLPVRATLLAWWRDEGGRSVTFGSDAHQPDEVGRHFARAAALAQAHGFRPGRDPFEPWPR